MTEVQGLLTEPTPRAARAVALTLLDVLDAEYARLERASDVEALHDFRVGLRRLRSWLRAYRRDVRDSVGKKAMRRLGALTAVTTDSRDIEVHLEWLKAETATLKPAERAGARWLSTRLRAEQKRADAALREGVGGGFTELSARLRKNLSRYAVAVWDQDGEERWAVTAAAQVQAAFLVLRRRITSIEDVDDDERTHRARIAGKRLRYLLEPLAVAIAGATESVELLKRAQDLLGSMHDTHVFTRLVRRHARSIATVKRGGVRVHKTRDPRRGLRTLASRLEARRDQAWAAFTKEWIERDFVALSTAVHTAVQVLRETGGQGVEIERKYLLRKLPAEAKRAPVAELEQGYLPGTVLIERLRREKKGDEVRYLRTVKLGSGLVRTEIEEACDYAIFKAMWPLTKGKRLRKRRYRLADAGHVWEIDEFLDRKLVLAEIELSSAREEVVIPEWLARCMVREVTDEPEYLNHTLAR